MHINQWKLFCCLSLSLQTNKQNSCGFSRYFNSCVFILYTDSMSQNSANTGCNINVCDCNSSKMHSPILSATECKISRRSEKFSRHCAQKDGSITTALNVNVPRLQIPTGGSYPGSLGLFPGRETATRPASWPKRCTFLADMSSWWAAVTPRWEIYSLRDKQD